jgi:saccharopine dehydrogenase-like NADP-dependent oxidoreductase
MARILIVGGYGAFGARAAERLARTPELSLVIAGRNAAAAAAFAAKLGGGASSAVVDATRVSAETLRGLDCRIVMNASGPFQAQDYTLARAAIAAGMHYLDLSDARAFVNGIAVLDADAKGRNVLVLSGASTVPAVSTAVVDHFSAGG